MFLKTWDTHHLVVFDPLGSPCRMATQEVLVGSSTSPNQIPFISNSYPPKILAISWHFGHLINFCPFSNQQTPLPPQNEIV